MEPTPVFDDMAGNSPPMRALFAQIEKVAPTDLTVLVLGESGTGKELVARSLHRRSTRTRGPFVPLNCGAIPLTLLESELFGHERGVFTGADRARMGYIESAAGGTLFLDEIAEMPPGAQAKLLRVLQDHCVHRLGATREHKVDVRVIAATHQNLPSLVAAGAFRADLYYRLNEVKLELPPLRARGDDVTHIARFVLAELSRQYGRPLACTEAAYALLRRHDWPGNVRELENCLRRAAAPGERTTLDAADLELHASGRPPHLAEILEQATEAAVRAALRRHGGALAAASAELDILVKELQRLAERFDVQPPSS